jgi:hypothetical protein
MGKGWGGMAMASMAEVRSEEEERRERGGRVQQAF